MMTLKTVVWLGVELLLCVMLADLLTGAFHWLEDAYGSPDWPVIGAAVIEPNLLHHARPRDMVANSWFESAKAPLAAAGGVGGLLLLLGAFTWQAALVLALGANANEIHKWAHRTRRENGALVNWLHDRGLLQTPRHHGMHHGGAKDSHYCILTNWLNPVLDRTGVWRGLERAIRAATSARPRGASAPA